VESNLKEIEENFSLSTEEFNTKQNRLKEITDSLKKKEEELNMLTSKMNGFDSERLKLSNDIEFTRNQSIEEYNELNKLKYELEQAQKRQDEMTSELADIEEKLGSYSDLKKEAENEFSQSKKEYDDTSSEVQSLQNATTTKKEKLKTLKVKLEDSFNSTKQLENEIIRTNDKLENIESFIENNEGFFEGVKSILSLKKDGKMTGVFGAVAELLTVDPAYEKAVEILLQSSMQFLVVENDTIAKKCVEYLKTNKAGRATFLPLNMAQASSLSEQEMSWIKESKGIVPAISAIHFSEEFKDVFASLIGRMVIATDLEVGTAFMKKYNAKVKIATIDGEVIQSGSISGGESKRQKANFFTKRRELDELKKLSETLESSLKSEKENYDKLSNDVQSLEKNVLSLDEKIEELKELLQEKNAFVTESKSKLERLDERFQEFEVQEQELSLNKKELFRQIVNYKMNIEEKGKLHQELTQKLEKAQVDLGHLESKFTEESQAKTDLLLSISTFKEEYRNIEEYLSDFNDDNDSLEDKIKKLYERKESEDNKIKEVVSLLQIQQGQLKTLSEQSTDMNKQIETMRTEISSLQNELNVLESELKEVRKDKEVKEKAWNQKQVYLSRKETELSNVIARLQETYEIEEASIATLERLEIDVAGSKKEIDRIKKRIQALGAINHEAIEQCSELEERYSKEKTQFDDIKQAKHDLMTLLTQVEGEMKERFTKTFNEIAGYFEKTFVDLFEGGRAKLTLVDPSDPLGSAIDIVAQPPGKKPQSINLLSGGEKAFTAVALIFAIITAKPSPFVVLDEVDAPLDDANVARFAYYLREFSKKTQFIIVTHRKGSMMVVADLAESPILNDEGREVSGKIYGVTQVERGCTIMFPHSISELRKKQA
jgi:chromosome segregation protein